MTHIWVRAETRDNEQRVGLTPDGAKALIEKGITVSVEKSDTRVIQDEAYADAGCQLQQPGSWVDAPADTIIFGLKELPSAPAKLVHRHIMFGHAFKGQADGRKLLDRFKAGGGALYDLEYLLDENARRVAAFGYWAGFAGAGVTLKGWAAQVAEDEPEPIEAYDDADEMIDDVTADLNTTCVPRPTALIIGALGRVGTGVADFCREVGVPVTLWDMAETASGGPFPEILEHDILFNCILATDGCPVFVPKSATTEKRRLTMIGDIACDPQSEFSPIKVYDQETTWDEPIHRAHDNPPLDVMAIDNLPSLLALESSLDFAEQLLPSLLTLQDLNAGVWGRARAEFDQQITKPEV